MDTKNKKNIPYFSSLPALAILANICALADFGIIKSSDFIVGFLFLSGSILSLIVYLILSLYHKKKNLVTKSSRFSNVSRNSLDPALQKTDDIQHEFAIDLWMKSVAKENDLKLFSEQFFRFLSKEFELVQGILFLKTPDTNIFKAITTYAYFNENTPSDFEEGEGLHGQVAKLKKHISVTEIPANQIKIISGLGEITPGQLHIIPLVLENVCIGILELAFFKAQKDEMINQMLHMCNKLTIGISERNN